MFPKNVIFKHFYATISTNLKPQQSNLLTHLQNCSTLRDLELIYVNMIKTSENQDCFNVNQFIGVCFNLKQMGLANLAYTQVENPNVFVYNAMIKGFSHCDSPIGALEMYLGMLRDGVCPTSFTFSSLIKACSGVFKVGFGEGVHAHVLKYGFGSHVFVQTALIDFYSGLGRVDEFRRLFDEMPEKDGFAWSTTISGLIRVGDLSSARVLFEEMPGRNIASWNTMISGYAKSGDVESATILFSQMPSRDFITWTTMIACYSQNKRFKEAIDVFKEMIETPGVSPDEVTMSSVLSACAHLGSLEMGRNIHNYLMQNRFEINVYIGSALVDMYAKCGSVTRSLVVFFKLREKNLFCWNSIIDGLAVHGYGEQALNMLKKMKKEKIKPNGVTFISILGACTHAGLVEVARKWFLSMTHDYNISPAIEHYGCMVDILSRAGQLEEALELIRRMTIEPNSVIWGALLGGCKLHGNLEIAQVSMEKLMNLEPDNYGYYVLLGNMYAEADRWSEVKKVRSVMKGKGVRKRCAGSSWIEMDEKVHDFVASDESHHLCSEIYMLLNELSGNLEFADYENELGVI